MDPPLMNCEPRNMDEWKMVAWISLHSCLCKEDMWITSKIDGIEDLSDIIFRQGQKTFILQFKNKEEPGELTEDDFLAPKTCDYSLLKFNDNIGKVKEFCERIMGRNVKNKNVIVIDFEEDIFNFLLEWLGGKLEICKEKNLGTELNEKEKNNYMIDFYKTLWVENKIPLLLEVKKNKVPYEIFFDSINKQNGFGITPLHYAVLTKNLEALEFILNKNPLILQDCFGNSPLHIAIGCCDNWKFCKNKRRHFINPCNTNCEGIHFEMASKILEYDSGGINLQNNAGDSPLHIGLYAKKFKLIKLLVSFNADESLLNEEKKTPVHLAAEFANYDILNELLIKKIDLNVEDKNKETPLFYAIRNNPKMVELLISKGARTNVFNKIGKSPHDIAFDQNLLRLSEFLFNLRYETEDYLGTPNSTPIPEGQTILHFAARHASYSVFNSILNKSPDLLDKQDKQGWSPLFHAVNSKRSIRTWLIYKGANVDLIDKQGQSLLHIAVKNNSFRGLKELLRQSVKNINKIDFKGWTPLFYAVNLKKENLTNLLVTYGADVNVIDCQGQTVLHLAAGNNPRGMLDEILFKKNLKIDKQDFNGYSALLRAVEANNMENIQYLINQGADIQLGNKRGETILHLAGKNGDNFSINQLLNKKCLLGVNIPTKSGWTPLFYAVLYNRINSVALLIRYEADVHKKDKNGKTVFDIAWEKGFYEIFGQLLKHKNNEKCKECLVILANHPLKLETVR